MKKIEVDSSILAMIICGGLTLEEKKAQEIASFLLSKETLEALTEKAASFIYARVIKKAKKEQEDTSDLESTVKWIPYINFFTANKGRFGTEGKRIFVPLTYIGIAACFASNENVETVTYFKKFLIDSNWKPSENLALLESISGVLNAEILAIMTGTSEEVPSLYENGSFENKPVATYKTLIEAIASEKASVVEAFILSSAHRYIDIVHAISAGLGTRLSQLSKGFENDSIISIVDLFSTTKTLKTYNGDAA